MYTRGLQAFSFDIRFIDTKTTVDGDRPWRMNVRIASNDLQWNGEWEEIRIPLSSFTEMGSWDENTWFNPQGDFIGRQLMYFKLWKNPALWEMLKYGWMPLELLTLEKQR